MKKLFNVTCGTVLSGILVSTLWFIVYVATLAVAAAIKLPESTLGTLSVLELVVAFVAWVFLVIYAVIRPPDVFK